MIKPINSNYYLDKFHRSDKQDLLISLHERDIHDMTLRIAYPYEDKHADEWLDFCMNNPDITKLPVIFAIRYKTGALVGSIGLEQVPESNTTSAEIGYWLAKTYWGQGIMTQAIKCMCEYGFTELSLKRITATVFTHNPASKRALEKCGFQYDGLLPKHRVKNGVPMDMLAFSLDNFCGQ